MFGLIKKFFHKETIKFSEFERFKFRKIAKKVFRLNYDLTHDKKKAKSITANQMREVYYLDKERFNKLYTTYLRKSV
mgnify:FL=1|uniref:Uncharacterized protein n=1 Tax=Siphoviridae sp. ctgn638 TaxID=2827913 RepID=A0A8S5TKU7_9CAUD|nr:MAG TPA: hypothetical protein [Siphoviridae sp. ctgn638]